MNASSRETKSLVIASSLPESLAQKVQVPGRSPPCRQRHLPVESRERPCPVMGLYSWLSSAHTHRKDPSTFSQKASPHTPLSSSHSFTSGKGSTDQVRCDPHAWPRFVSPAVPWLVVSAGTRGRPPTPGTIKPFSFWGEGALLAVLQALVCRTGQGKRNARIANSHSGFKEELKTVPQASHVHFV